MTIGMALVACFALLFAAVKTEVRMYVHQKGNVWNTTVNNVDSVKFRDDEVDGKTVERIHVFRKGEASAWSAVTENVDSIDFRLDTLRYLVTFMDGETVLSAQKYDYGTMPECEFPVSESSRLKTYDFFWNPKLTLVVDDATYILDSTLIYYKYRFVDYNGEILKDTAAEYNYEPKVSVLPIITRDSIFTFREWARDESKIADAIIMLAAVYDTTPHLYTRMYYNCDTLFKEIGNCAYDSVVTMDNPKRKSTEVYKYDFNGWTLDESKIDSDTLVYTAVYDTTKILYTRMYYNCDTLFAKVESCTYDSVVKVAEPTRKRSEVYKYDFNSWTLDESKIALDTLIYTAKYDSTEHGMLTVASFKISDTKSVYFSKGNLQFTTQGTHKTADSTAEKGTWRFAENQWDVVEDGNANIAEDYTGWIDLFGWGTSGWNSGANAYQPWSNSESSSDYCPGSNAKNLTDSYANADWGVYNAISNGGNEPNKWRTLTTSEWQYLFQNNKWTLGYIKTTEKDSSLCFMLIPETFTAPEGTTVTVLSMATSSTALDDLAVPSTNTYTTEQFTFLEKSGVVALPCGGNRYEETLIGDGFGFYWSSSVYGLYLGSGFNFNSSNVISNALTLIETGLSVRLVYDLNYDIHFVNPDGTTLLDTTVVRGATPTYTREEPTMASTKEYVFDFVGWNKKFVAAESDMVYTAVYDSMKIPYTRLYYSCDTLFKEIGNCAYDSVVTMDNPKRKSTEVYKYDFNGWTLDESKIDSDTLIYTAVYDSTEHGMLTYASFKVSDTKSVYFSKGNLQFTTQGSHKTADSTAKGTWRFAEDQWKSVGSTNSEISESYTGWIDLFCWGTSGWKSGANAYQPWSKSETYSDYYPGGSYSNSLIGDYAKADWGVYNAISNGGNEPNNWRTPTREEWLYLIRNNSWTLGKVDETVCLMLVPKEIDETKIKVLSTGLKSEKEFGLTIPSTNIYSAEQFKEIEKMGVVALPYGGVRVGTMWEIAGMSGYYWLSSVYDSSDAYGFHFYSSYVNSGTGNGRHCGFSVRLVQDLIDIHFVNPDGTTLLDTTVVRGATPTYTREKPTMATTKAYTFDFVRWDKEFVSAECDMVYTAVYDSTPFYYTSVFKDYDNTTINTVKKCVYDSVLNGKELNRRNAYYRYDFNSWTRDESKIASDTLVYTAVYDTTKILYTRMYYNCDTLFAKVENCTYDSVVKVAEPTRKRSEVYKYDFNSWTLDESKIALDTLIYTAKYDSTEHGMLTVASFKISDTKSAYFSKGNLQFTTQGTHKTADSTAKGTWRFAENQYDYIGSANSNISETYTGWIDLFGWGTSGWNSKATCYQPWSTTATNSYYYPGGSSSNDLTGTYANADWGVYNAISNGGNEPNKWRTLTNAEWKYLFQNNKWTLGYINDSTKSYLCFMLIPETFTAPEGTTVTVLSTTTTSTYLSGLTVPLTNKYTTEQFASLEKLGVVALPCGGGRDGASVYCVGSLGYYWSSSVFDSDDAYVFLFDSTRVSSDNYYYRNYGGSVRLVQDL